jgi:hypothetical protein
MIEMAVGKNSIGTVHLIPDKILMKQKLDMTMFEITSWSLDYKDNHDGLRVLIVMKRKFVSEIMTTYFPSSQSKLSSRRGCLCNPSSTMLFQTWSCPAFASSEFYQE